VPYRVGGEWLLLHWSSSIGVCGIISKSAGLMFGEGGWVEMLKVGGVRASVAWVVRGG
jgi:hypothetical protein